MKVLVVGSGGREHTLVWTIAKSKKVEKIYCCPGNAGTAELAENLDIKANDLESITNFVKENSIDLTVVGPEDPLVEGLIDKLEAEGFKAFGPKAKAAEIEGSKAFSKDFMKKYSIPTADYEVFSEKNSALSFLEKTKDKAWVVKASGLAAGKGVLICNNKKEAKKAVEEIMEDKKFGEAGDKVVIEEFLEGEEASILAFCDGKNVKLMVSSQDHKRVFDNDKGLNTGGMGAYSPAPIVTKKLEEKILKTVMQPAVKGLKNESREYKGVLYAGLMIKGEDLKVLEFNARFGDPETQVVLPRLESDLVEVMLACIEGKLNKVEVKWRKDASTCVVLASKGYPEAYEKGKEITGLDLAAEIPGAIVFHAGTKFHEEKVVTSGGRVLGVTGLGKDLYNSIERAYTAVKEINFEGMHYRKDIGKKGLKRLEAMKQTN